MNQTTDRFECVLGATEAYVQVRAMIRQCPDSVQRFIEEMADQAMHAPESSSEQQLDCAAIAAALLANLPTSLPAAAAPPRPASKHAKAVAFAEQLRSLRKAHGLTQAQLADAVGLRQSTISMMENAQCRPEPSTLAKLAARLGATPDALWPSSAVASNGHPASKQQREAS